MPPPDPKPGILSLQFFVYPDAIGGAWKYTHEVNRRLVERGWPVHMITCKPSPQFPDEEVIDGVTFHRIATADSKKFFRLGRKLRKKLEALMETESFRLAHVHNPLVGYLAMKSDVWKDITNVVHVHSLWQDEEKINRLGPGTSATFLSPFWWRLQFIRYMEGALFRKAGSCLFLSQYMRQCFLDSFGFKKPRLRVIPGGVDIEHFKPSDSPGDRAVLREKLKMDRPTLLTVRRLEPRMGIDRLIDAVAQVRSKRPELDFNLVIIGKGSQADLLQSKVNSAGLEDRVQFTGEVNSDDLINYYQAADAFVLPTTELEGFGLATVEALACGLPALGTPVGGTVEILRSIDDSLLFSNVTSDAMARRLETFLENPEPFYALKPKCREVVVTQYGWESVVDRIEEEFSLLLHI